MEKFLQFMSKVMSVGDRLKEAGTWRLIAAIVATTGAQFSPEQVEGILLILALVFVLWESLQPDATTDAPDG